MPRDPAATQVRAAGTALAIGLATLAAVLVAAPAPAAADTCDGVWVIVDATALGGSVTTRCAPGDPGSGLDALTAVGHRYDFVPRVPGFVCQIDARPDPCNGAPADAYWSYWNARQGGAWSYASQGAARDVVPGDVEGWRFGDGSQPPGVAPPVAAPAPPPEPPASQPGGSSSGGTNGSGSSGASSGSSGGSASGGTGSTGSGSGGSASSGSGSGSSGGSAGTPAGGASGTGTAGASTSSPTNGSSDAAASASDRDADAAGREPSADPRTDVGDEEAGTATGAMSTDGPDESARTSGSGSVADDASDPSDAPGPGPDDEVVLAGADTGGDATGLLVAIVIVVGLLAVAGLTWWRRRLDAA